MKRTVVIASLLILAMNLPSSSAPAAECKSIAQITSDIWKKWAAVGAALGCQALAAEGDISANVCANSSKYPEAVNQMLAFYNQEVNNNWAEIGPRKIEFGTSQEGDVIGPGERVFISPAPVNKDSVTIKIKKLDGRARTSVVICKITQNNIPTKLAEFEFAEGDGNAGEEITKTVSGVRNQLVQVHLHAETVSRRLHYSLRADKN